jgi:peptidoglycan/xylan/chitin deacetylase (PgdA/CDA1 family)
VRTDRPLVALTFDDGPDPRLTPAVLDVLRGTGVRATFLLVAERVREHIDLARRVVAEGHEVGLHGDRHVNMQGQSFQNQYLALRRGRRDVEALLDLRLRWFRAPYGKQGPATVLACRLTGMQPLLWSTSAHDWQPDPIEAQLTHVAGGLKPGAIVLLHDGAADIVQPPAPPPRTQPELLRRLLDLIQQRSLRSVTVSELCEAGLVEREPWFRQWLHH